ncbi:MAG: hypothetical protein ACJ8AW_08015 [Rhodopila sp.]
MPAEASSQTSTAGTVSSSPSVSLLTGIGSQDSVGGAEIPPDNGLAVNNGYIVSVSNGIVKWTDLTGAGAYEQSMSKFFSPISASSYFVDARALYNTGTDQFIISASAPDVSGAYHVFLGISRDGNPNDGFDFKQYQYSASAFLIDQPTVAADGPTLFVTASVGDQQSVLIIGNDGNGPVQEVDLSGGGIYKPVAAQGSGAFLVAQDAGTITVAHMSTAGLLDATSAVSLGAISTNYGESYLPTQGTTTPIDAGDSRIYSLALNGDTLYATFEVTPPSGPDAGVPNAHWVELDVHDPTNIALIDQGTISGAAIGPGVGTSTSSIAVDAKGDAIMNFVASGSTMTPTDYFAIKPAGASSFADLTAYATSAGPFVEPNATDFGPERASRFGDYSSAITDPNMAGAFYLSNEVGTVPNSWQWATTLAHVTLPTTAAV